VDSGKCLRYEIAKANFNTTKKIRQIKMLNVEQRLMAQSWTLVICKNLILELLKIGYKEKAGRLAGEFLSYIPQNNPDRPIFKKYGAVYREAQRRKKRRRH
jgi:hypothetical protein